MPVADAQDDAMGPTARIRVAIATIAVIVGGCGGDPAPPIHAGTTSFETRLFQIEGTFEQWVQSGCATSAGCGVVIDLTDGTQRWRIMPEDVGPSFGLPATIAPGEYLVGFSWRRYLTEPVPAGDRREMGDLVAWCQMPFTVRPDQVSVQAVATHDARDDSCAIEIHET
jgi:hypothetical protein